MPKQELPYWLAASYVKGARPRMIQRLLEKFNDIVSVFQASAMDLREAGLSELEVALIREPDWRAVEKDLRWAENKNHQILTLRDEIYPRLLKEISSPPLILYILGDPAVLSQPQVAIIGSRHPTNEGISRARAFAETLVKSGYVITSGLALGIDGASHRGALLAYGRTIGVLGTGLNQIYPTSHQRLADEIVETRGAVISEFPLEMQALPSNFPRRNRIIAGLSVGVLVVEAALKSGSLITAKCALNEGREVFAIPGSIDHPLSRGCHHLIRQGAKLVETAQDILEDIGILSQLCTPPKPDPQKITLSVNNRLVYDQVGGGVTSVDEILLRSGLTAGEVSSILLILELDGYIQSVAGGYRRNGGELLMENKTNV